MQGVKCNLAQGNVGHIVARGTLVPSLPTDMCHGVKLGAANYKVTVDDVIDGFAPLPIPSFDIIRVGDAEGAFVAWPRDLVILPSEEVLFDAAIYINEV